MFYEEYRNLNNCKHLRLEPNYVSIMYLQRTREIIDLVGSVCLSVCRSVCPDHRGVVGFSVRSSNHFLATFKVCWLPQANNTPGAHPSVCLSVWVYPGHIIHHYNGIWATCAPGRRNLHHSGAICTTVHKGDYIF